jgi:hypothetical protein
MCSWHNNEFQGAQCLWEANSRSAINDIARLLVKPKGTIQRSQGTTTDPYLKPDESSPHIHINLRAG